MWGTRGGENKHEERIAALERAVEGLKSAERLQKVEWESVLNKVGKVMGRLNASIRKSEGLSVPESDDPAAAQVEVPVGSHASLIQMRRRRGVLPG